MGGDYLQGLFGLTGQVAVVIGGTGVLGGALADGLARAGATVIIAGKGRDRGIARAEAITAAGGVAGFHEVDATDPAALKTLLDMVVRAERGVDVLVNCAGVNDSTPYEQLTLEAWHRVLETNLTATHLACQAFAPAMVASGRGGAILNIGSVTADKPLSKVFAYSASKAAVVNLTQNLAREYARSGVRVNCLCPGFFPAEQNRNILDAGRTQSILGQTPMGRFGEPNELVGAALLLCSREAGRFITGSVLYVDGGFTAMRF